MSFQFGNRCFGGPSSTQLGLSGYGQSYTPNYPEHQTPYNNFAENGHGSKNYQQNLSNCYTSSTSQYKGIYGGQQQQVANNN